MTSPRAHTVGDLNRSKGLDSGAGDPRFRSLRKPPEAGKSPSPTTRMRRSRFGASEGPSDHREPPELLRAYGIGARADVDRSRAVHERPQLGVVDRPFEGKRGDSSEGAGKHTACRAGHRSESSPRNTTVRHQPRASSLRGSAVRAAAAYQARVKACRSVPRVGDSSEKVVDQETARAKP